VAGAGASCIGDNASGKTCIQLVSDTSQHYTGTLLRNSIHVSDGVNPINALVTQLEDSHTTAQATNDLVLSAANYSVATLQNHFIIGLSADGVTLKFMIDAANGDFYTVGAVHSSCTLGYNASTGVVTPSGC
jgi:hypothetical protein